jgi:hypothetical protein
MTRWFSVKGPPVRVAPPDEQHELAGERERELWEREAKALAEQKADPFSDYWRERNVPKIDKE